jgi:hypothetical protein
MFQRVVPAKEGRYSLLVFRLQQSRFVRKAAEGSVFGDNRRTDDFDMAEVTAQSALHRFALSCAFVHSQQCRSSAAKRRSNNSGQLDSGM